MKTSSSSRSPSTGSGRSHQRKPEPEHIISSGMVRWQYAYLSGRTHHGKYGSNPNLDDGIVKSTHLFTTRGPSLAQHSWSFWRNKVPCEVNHCQLLLRLRENEHNSVEAFRVVLKTVLDWLKTGHEVRAKRRLVYLVCFHELLDPAFSSNGRTGMFSSCVEEEIKKLLVNQLRASGNS